MQYFIEAFDVSMMPSIVILAANLEAEMDTYLFMYIVYIFCV